MNQPVNDKFKYLFLTEVLH